ncbi:MAG: DUF4142 domain-containing protein [Chitinophagales bacterium]
MKYLLVLILFLAASACEQSGANKSTAQTTSIPPAEAIDPAAKKFLIDITNLSWFQAQLGQAALKKSTDTIIISMSQRINKEYIRVKDKAKIVSIPYQIDMPYFLTHDQNEEVKQMASLDEATFTKQYLEKIKHNNEMILQKCQNFDTSSTSDENFQELISFCLSTVERNSIN